MMNNAVMNNTVNILLVEDDVVDVMNLKRTFRKLKIANPVHVANDGIEALEVLRGEGGKGPIPHPFVILLDLNLPRMHGLEFLTELRKDPEFRNSVVFVLTTSKSEEEKLAAYDLKIAGYILKKDIAEGFI